MSESLSNPLNLYKELLYTFFEKTSKQIQKRYKEISLLINQYTEQVKDDRELNANKYYGVFKLSIETRDSKLVETSVYYLYKLVSHGFIDGNCPDYVQDLHLEENKSSLTQLDVFSADRRLIDSIVENVCSCKNEKNDNIQLQLIKLLLTFVTSLLCEVHGKSLQEIVRTLYTVYLTTKNPVNESIARAALTQINTLIFQRMEEYSKKEEEFQAPRPTQFLHSKTKHFEKKRFGGELAPPLLLHQSSSHSLTGRTSSPEPSVFDRILNSKPNDDTVSIISGAGMQDLPERASEAADARYNQDDGFETPDERYIYRCVNNLVDDVCLFYGKYDNLKGKYEKSEGEKRKDYKTMLRNLPLKAVPWDLEADSLSFRMLVKPDIKNESGENAGYFGWCIMCRSTANLYCKETRVPVCSVECKAYHLKELQHLKEHQKFAEDIASNVYFQDAFQIFVYLCKLSGKDPITDSSATSLKSKTLTLELIVNIMENAGPTFLTREEFRAVIKDHLCDSILKSSVSTEKPVFAFSLGIFVALVTNFRDILKAEIAVFIENIFLKMLESNNSSFNHRLLALQVFYKMTLRARTMLEFYVNYDCKMDSTNVVEKMVDLLCKIVQGKYLRSEYSALITAQNEPKLRHLALDSLVNLARALVIFTEDYQKKLEEINKQKNNTSYEAERDGGEDYEPTEDLAFEKGDGIEKQRTLKIEIHKAIQKFNFKTKSGMKLFEKLGVFKPDDARAIADFFYNASNLSKEKLGEYFGEEHEINIKVMTEYTELVHMKGFPLDTALREYLNHFYLPGESQKIDRIMQAFASKFFKDNPRSFNSANAAYTLSYLLIMLQTDAHNPQIKKEERMKLDQFIRLARGINDGMDLPPEELTGYYNRIQEKPLAVREEAKKPEPELNQAQSVKKKEEQFKLESAKMIEKGKELIKKKKDDPYKKITNTDYVRKFFSEILWSPILAAFGASLERSEDPRIVQSCLEGLSNCIILTGLLRMDTERDTFLLGLVKFTHLKPVREIKEKNAKCIKLLLHLANTYGQYFRSSWKYVLENISKIDYYLHYSPSQNQTDVYINEVSRNAKPDSSDSLDQINSEMIKNIVDPNAINHIFSRSSTFNLEQILDFITCLCQMSDEELKNPHGPSIFGLQKLVEVAHFNMDRIKFIWSQIWNIMREHISNVAINSSLEVAFFAVDSLKQLSIKFLMKEEFATSLEFQKEFLKPFETICSRVQSDDIKELILNCCNYIISHVMKNIKSGWKIIVDTLIIAADTQKEILYKLSFDIADKIIKENIEALREVYGDLSTLLLKLCGFNNEEMSLACLKNLKRLTTSIVQQHESRNTHRYEGQAYLSFNDLDAEGNEGDRIVLVYGIEESKAKFFNAKNNSLLDVWVKMMRDLAFVCNNSRKRVHIQSVITLFEILRSYGDGFSKEKWRDIMTEAIKPLFTNMQISFQTRRFVKEEEFQIHNEASREAFMRMIDIYNLYYNKLSYLVDLFLEILAHSSESSNEQFAQTAVKALRYLINCCNVHFKEREWNLVIKTFSDICKNTTPSQLLNYSLNENGPDVQVPAEASPQNSEKPLSDKSLVQCVVQVMMIALIKDVMESYGHRLTDTQMSEVSTVLYTSYQFAKKFNEQIYLRFVLWKKGPLSNADQLPALLKQEKESISAYILITFNLYTRKKNSEDADPAIKERLLNEFIDLGLNLVKNFCRKNEDYLNMSKQEKITEKQLENNPVPGPGQASSITNLNAPKMDKKVPSLTSLNKPPIIVESVSVEEDFRRQSTKLTIHELEREILNTKAIISSVFLANLSRLDPKEMKERLREIVSSLVSLSFYYIPKTDGLAEPGSLNPAASQIKEDHGSIIKMLLMKYYDYLFSHLPSASS